MKNWILPNERLPESDTPVLVTLEEGTETESGTLCGRQVEKAYFVNDQKDNWYPYFTIDREPQDVRYVDEIVAWMPLPEPYESV